MNYNDFKKAVIHCAQTQGIEEYDLYFSKGQTTSVRAFEGEIDNFSDNNYLGACFRCIVDGKMGYSNTQLLNESEAERLVLDAKAAAAVIETQGESEFFKGGKEYASISMAEDFDCDVDKLKEISLSMEKIAKAKDSRIEAVSYAVAAFSGGEKGIYNPFGVDLINRQKGYQIYCAVVASHEGRKYTGGEGGFYNSLDEIDVDAVVTQAVKLAVGSIGGKAPLSGSYPIVLSPDAFAQFIECFADIFSADAVQKGLSLLGGKENELIAAANFTLIDDPHFEKSGDRSPFDDEGVPTFVKPIIENGKLNTLLYDLKSAAKAGKESTGNGKKYSYVSSVDVSPFTLRVTPGKLTSAELLKKAGTGIYVTDMKGFHSGANQVTGDFSIDSKGLFFENGEITRPVEQFTIAGNFYQMLKNIEEVGSDVKLCDSVETPSVLISGLSTAGEEK